MHGLAKRSELPGNHSKLPACANGLWTAPVHFVHASARDFHRSRCRRGGFDPFHWSELLQMGLPPREPLPLWTAAPYSETEPPPLGKSSSELLPSSTPTTSLAAGGARP